MPLPALPRHAIEVVSEQREGEGGFSHLRRVTMRVRYEGGGESDAFVYDALGRERLDATVMAAHYVEGGRRFVYLRTALRPPPFLRPMEARPVPERASVGGLWELPAGLVEADERSPEGLARSAAREIGEELGFTVAPEELRALGPSTFPAPGIIGERHFYFHVEVDPRTRAQPTLDGSPLEVGAKIVAIPLDEAIELTRLGEIEDAKTEIALRRLAELHLGAPK
ncbi:MAG TPA: NUDIX hydrolase [Byssovorax sp.]|jgi:ADP-ribose pyrophosphatase